MVFLLAVIAMSNSTRVSHYYYYYYYDGSCGGGGDSGRTQIISVSSL
jgi:hypothetical protein